MWTCSVNFWVPGHDCPGPGRRGAQPSFRMKETFLIEFVGLPGAGKSTVTQKVIAELNSRGYACPGYDELQQARAWGAPIFIKTPRYFSFLWFLCRHPGLLIRVLSFSARVRPLNRTSIWRGVVLLRRIKLFRDCASRNYDVIILEEGILQGLWSIALTGVSRDPAGLFRTILDRYVKGRFAFLYLEIDSNTAFQRVRERKGNLGHRIDGMSDSKLHGLLDRHAERLRRLAVEEAHALRLDGAESVASISGQIVQWTESQVSRTPPRSGTALNYPERGGGAHT
jgi:gluconate kinase